MPCDYSKYPSNWKTEIVPRILKRANNICEVCGVDNYAHLYSIKMWIRDVNKYKYKAIWVSDRSDKIRLEKYSNDIKLIRVVLTIAHLDHDEENHNVKDDRLKAMCQMCHLAYDAKEKYQRRLRKHKNSTNQD